MASQQTKLCVYLTESDEGVPVIAIEFDDDAYSIGLDYAGATALRDSLIEAVRHMAPEDSDDNVH